MSEINLDPEEPSEDDVPPVSEDLTGLAEAELRRRTEAPLPRSLTDFLR